MKTCSNCGVEKPATAEFFITNKSCRGGLAGWCRPCSCKKMRAWKVANKDRISARRRALYAESEGRTFKLAERARMLRDPVRYQAQRLAGSIRERCKEMGLPRPEWAKPHEIEKWLVDQPLCACCNVPFNIKLKPGRWRDDGPSFDRRVPGATYERENVNLICWRCNNIKRNYCADDLRMVAKWIDSLDAVDSASNAA